MNEAESLINDVISSLKGISGTGDILAALSKLSPDTPLTLEPGDYTSGDANTAAPIGYDLWYLWTHDNFLEHYHTEETTDYEPYLGESLEFLQRLPGLKPLRTVKNLSQLVATTVTNPFVVFGQRTEWINNGIYWVNTIAFELWNTDAGMQYGSDGTGPDFKPNDYAGYLTFPMGQLGVMEVISLMQETKLSGYRHDGASLTEPAEVRDEYLPLAYGDPADSMFPPPVHVGMNYCYGNHLIESGYVTKDPGVELFASPLSKYRGEVKPKKWFRFWITKTSTFPVPGEFIGILCKPMVAPPHIWWFQESTPLLYAGNWIETGNLTSGVVVSVTLEADRPSGSIGDEYEVRIQGCTVTVHATDFFIYKEGDRVAVVKMDTIAEARTTSFTWNDQATMKDTDKETTKSNYVLAPFVFYKPAA